MVAQLQQTHALAVAAAYGDTLGVPAIFDQSLLPALQNLEGAQGASRLLASLGQAVGRVPFPGGLLDVDTPEQYAALLANEGPTAGRPTQSSEG
ncbi:hypothetical protein ACFQT0_00875 [Hymenobacter humi]|uniref:MobA-like NTP transferase domain-containing protein n=1 Tax=Hymenobacter humi TaxID=1411620 RepID=A0ABW2TY38_9BACT